VKNQIIGAWELLSFEIEDLQGNRRAWGVEATGLLLYSQTGHMSVSIHKNSEQKHDIEAQNIFDSILFYSGTYSVEDNKIKHQVTQASNPSRIGKEMLRYAELRNDILSLESPTESFGKAILKWKKV
jgi:hypothetical protein